MITTHIPFKFHGLLEANFLSPFLSDSIYSSYEFVIAVYEWTRLNSGKALDAGVLLLNTSHHLMNWMTTGRGRGRGSQVASSTQWTLQTGLAKNGEKFSMKFLNAFLGIVFPFTVEIEMHFMTDLQTSTHWSD
jgi:hypothetical protein